MSSAAPTIIDQLPQKLSGFQAFRSGGLRRSKGQIAAIGSLLLAALVYAGSAYFSGETITAFQIGMRWCFAVFWFFIALVHYVRYGRIAKRPLIECTAEGELRVTHKNSFHQFPPSMVRRVGIFPELVTMTTDLDQTFEWKLNAFADPEAFKTWLRETFGDRLQEVH